MKKQQNFIILLALLPLFSCNQDKDAIPRLVKIEMGKTYILKEATVTPTYCPDTTAVDYAVDCLPHPVDITGFIDREFSFEDGALEGSYLFRCLNGRPFIKHKGEQGDMSDNLYFSIKEGSFDSGDMTITVAAELVSEHSLQKETMKIENGQLSVSVDLIDVNTGVIYLYGLQLDKK